MQYDSLLNIINEYWNHAKKKHINILHLEVSAEVPSEYLDFLQTSWAGAHSEWLMALLSCLASE